MKEQNGAASFKKTGFPAHVLKSSEGYLTQDVIDHCRKTAEYAHTCLQSIGLGNVAYLAGLMHDLGKCTKASKKYQEGVARGENLKRGSVIHTFQCCRFFLEEHSDEAERSEEHDGGGRQKAQRAAWDERQHRPGSREQAEGHHEVLGGRGEERQTGDEAEHREEDGLSPERDFPQPFL